MRILILPSLMDKSLCRQVTKNDCNAHCCLDVKLNVGKNLKQQRVCFGVGRRAGKPDLYPGEKGRAVNI